MSTLDEQILAALCKPDVVMPSTDEQILYIKRYAKSIDRDTKIKIGLMVKPTGALRDHPEGVSMRLDTFPPDLIERIYTTIVDAL